jgi:hypothetical protein
MAMPNDCAEFEDTLSLHKDKTSCMTRIEEMIGGIIPTLPPVPVQFYFKCEKVDSI